MDIRDPKLRPQIRILTERECKNGHRYFAKSGDICPNCGLPLDRVTGETSMLPVVGD